MTARWIVYLVGVWMVGAPVGGKAQSLDVRMTHAIYAYDGPILTTAFEGASHAFEPLVIGAGPSMGAVALISGGSLRPTIRLGAAQVSALGATVGLKALVNRSRPAWVIPEIIARDADYATPSRWWSSFPSGHASMAFATATSVSLSEPAWYVVGPAFTWAALTGGSRIWQGVHYPSDVVAGAALGVAAAWAAHAMLPPQNDATGEPSVPTVHLVIPL